MKLSLLYKIPIASAIFTIAVFIVYNFAYLLEVGFPFWNIVFGKLPNEHYETGDGSVFNMLAFVRQSLYLLGIVGLIIIAVKKLNVVVKKI